MFAELLAPASVTHLHRDVRLKKRISSAMLFAEDEMPLDSIHQNQGLKHKSTIMRHMRAIEYDCDIGQGNPTK